MLTVNDLLESQSYTEFRAPSLAEITNIWKTPLRTLVRDPDTEVIRDPNATVIADPKTCNN